MFDTPLAHDIHGIDFLRYYAILMAMTATMSWLICRTLDQSRRLPPAEVPQQPDPYLIAYLRGGANELFRIAMFALAQRGYLKPAEGPNAAERYVERASQPPDPSQLETVERFVYDCVDRPKCSKDLFGDPSITTRVQELSNGYEERLRAENMLMPPNSGQMAAAIGVLSCLLVCGIGLYKFGAAVSQGRHNVGFLLMMTVLFPILMLFLLRQSRLTARGRMYVKTLQAVFGGCKDAPPNGDQGGTNALLLGVGLFGVSVLAATAYSHYEQMFHRSAAASFSGGCGAASSCGASGCGGGGCGGGGCGGGGCGG